MKMRREKNSEMLHPQIKICQFCGGEVSREERICPECGRLLVRNLRKTEWKDFIEPDTDCEDFMCMAGDNQEAFEATYEEKETAIYCIGNA